MRDASSLPIVAALVLGLAAPARAQVESTSETSNWFQSAVETLGRDLKNVGSKDTAMTLAIGAALALALKPMDHTLTRQAHTSPALDRTFEVGEQLGSGWVLSGGALAVALTGHAMGNTRAQTLGADLVRAQVINALLTQGIKVAVSRTRPDGGRYSFPSGHSSAVFATAAVVERHFGWKAAIPAYATAGYVAVSRLQENRHFASDVIFGAAIGIVAGRSVTIGRGAGRFAVTPMITPHGAGVMFARATGDSQPPGGAATAPRR